MVNGLLPDYLQSYIEVPSQDSYPFRSVSAGRLKPLPFQSKSFKKAFFPNCIDDWSKYAEVRNATSMYKFKK